MFSIPSSRIFAWDSAPDLDSFLVTAECRPRFQWVPKVKVFQQWISLPVFATLCFFPFTSCRPWTSCRFPSNREAKGQDGGVRTASAVSIDVPAFTILSTQKASKCFSETKATESLSSLRLKTHFYVILQLCRILSVCSNPDRLWCFPLPRLRISTLLPFPFSTVVEAT